MDNFKNINQRVDKISRWNNSSDELKEKIKNIVKVFSSVVIDCTEPTSEIKLVRNNQRFIIAVFSNRNI